MTAADTWCNWLWQGIPTVIEKRTGLTAWIRLNFTLQTSWVALHFIVRESDKDLWHLTKSPLFFMNHTVQTKYFLKAYHLGHTLAAPLSYWGFLDIYLWRAAFAIPVIFIYFVGVVFVSPFWLFPFSSSPLFNLRWHQQALSIMAREGRGEEGARCVLNKYFMEIVELV